MPTIGQRDSYVEWSCVEQTGLLSWMTKSTVAGSCRFLPWRTNTTPILKCVPIREHSAEEREKLIVGAAAAVTRICRYFEATRLVERQPFDNVTTFRRTAPKNGATIRVHVDQERNSSSAVEELHSIEMASVTPRVTLLKNADTSVEQIERFYARNLPLSKEMAINLRPEF